MTDTDQEKEGKRQKRMRKTLHNPQKPLESGKARAGKLRERAFFAVDDEEIAWSDVDQKMALQILKQGETYLTAQLQAALAADARAAALAGLYTTLSLAVFAGGLGYWDKTGNLSALLSAIASGTSLAIAAALSAYAARPIDFYFPGNAPRNWIPYRKAPLVPMIGGEAEHCDRGIAANDLQLSKNQHAVRRAYWFAIGAPFAGLAGWLLPVICSFCPAVGQ